MSHALFAGQTALVTGGAHRLGRAIVEALAAEGAAVVIHYNRSADAAEGLAAQVREAGGQAAVIGADLADPAQVDDLVERASALVGGLDILVNNASIFQVTTLDGLRPEDLAENVQVNAWSPLMLARALGARGRPGQVVNLLDTRITASHDPDRLAYYLSKRTLADVTRLLAVELAPDIRVNGVAPGAIMPPADAPEGYFEGLAAGLPLRRTGGAPDIVGAVRFLLQSPFVTGQVIFVDGGQHLLGSSHD